MGLVMGLVVGLVVGLGVGLMTITGHTSHGVQPLDADVFRALKNKVPNFHREPCEWSIPNFSTARLTAATRALYQAMFPGVVLSAFDSERAGIFPFNADLILNEATKVAVAEGRLPDSYEPVNAVSRCRILSSPATRPWLMSAKRIRRRHEMG